MEQALGTGMYRATCCAPSKATPHQTKAGDSQPRVQAHSTQRCDLTQQLWRTSETNQTIHPRSRQQAPSNRCHALHHRAPEGGSSLPEQTRPQTSVTATIEHCRQREDTSPQPHKCDRRSARPLVVRPVSIVTLRPSATTPGDYAPTAQQRVTTRTRRLSHSVITRTQSK